MHPIAVMLFLISVIVVLHVVNTRISTPSMVRRSISVAVVWRNVTVVVMLSPVVAVLLAVALWVLVGRWTSAVTLVHARRRGAVVPFTINSRTISLGLLVIIS